MVPGNLFSAGALAASVYLPMLHKGALIPVVSKVKKNEFPGRPPGGSKQEVPGAKKGVLKLVDRGSESGG